MKISQMKKEELLKFLEENVKNVEGTLKDMINYSLSKKEELNRQDVKELAMELNLVLAPQKEVKKLVKKAVEKVEEKEVEEIPVEEVAPKKKLKKAKTENVEVEKVEEEKTDKPKKLKKAKVVEEVKKFEFPVEVENDFGKFKVVENATLTEIEKMIESKKNIILACVWSKDDLKNFTYDSCPAVENPTAFKDDLDVMNVVYNNGKLLYAISVYTDSMKVFIESDFTDKISDGLEFRVYKEIK